MEIKAQKTKNPPENEDKEDEEWKEDGDVVHCTKHDEQLSAQLGHKPHEFENPQEAKCPEDRQAGPGPGGWVVCKAAEVPASATSLNVRLVHLHDPEIRQANNDMNHMGTSFCD